MLNNIRRAYQLGAILGSLISRARERSARRVYPVLGIIGPVIYTLAVIIGGALRTDYSQMANTVSELTVPNAPHHLLVDAMFMACNVCVAAFGAGAYFDARLNTGRHYKRAIALLGLGALVGFLLVFFPTNLPGSPPTVRGSIHLVIVALLSLLAIVSIMLVGLHFKNDARMKLFVIHSFVSWAIVVVSGVATLISVIAYRRYGGLVEKITIGVFFQWLIGFSIVLLMKKRPAWPGSHP